MSLEQLLNNRKISCYSLSSISSLSFNEATHSALQITRRLYKLCRGRAVLDFRRQPPLQHYWSLSVKTRSHLALLGGFIERTAFLVPIQTVLLLAVFLLIVYQTVVRHFRRLLAHPYQCHFLFDGFLVLAILYHVLIKVIFALKVLILVCFALYRHARDVTRLAALLTNRTLLQWGNGLISREYLSSSIATAWTTFSLEHSGLLVDLIHLNRCLASSLIFWYFFPVFCGSIYIFCLLYFRPLPWTVKAPLLVSLISCFITFSLLSMLTTVVGGLYYGSAGGQLYRAQMWCGGMWHGTFLSAKLKLMRYYEVLCTRNKVTFTFGTHSKVESKWLWEVRKEN